MRTTVTSVANSAVDQSPTVQAYRELQAAYDHFNAVLFDNRLPPCLITLQRKGRGTFGYYAAERFGSASGQTTDEIALNPRWFKERPLIDVLKGGSDDV